MVLFLKFYRPEADCNWAERHAQRFSAINTRTDTRIHAYKICTRAHTGSSPLPSLSLGFLVVSCVQVITCGVSCAVCCVPCVQATTRRVPSPSAWSWAPSSVSLSLCRVERLRAVHEEGHTGLSGLMCANLAHNLTNLTFPTPPHPPSCLVPRLSPYVSLSLSGVEAIPAELGKGQLVEWERCEKLLRSLPLLKGANAEL